MTERSVTEIADLIGEPVSTVHDWVARGDLRSHKAGRNRLVADEDLIPFLAKREASGSQRERLARAQAERVEMDNSARRGQLIHADLVEETLMGQAAYLAQAHDAVAGRLAHELAGITDPGIIRAKILVEMREIREGLSQYGLRTADALEQVAQELERDEAAAEPDGESVGGPDKASPRRKRRTRKVAK